MWAGPGLLAVSLSKSPGHGHWGASWWEQRH